MGTSNARPTDTDAPRMGGVALANGLILVSERYWAAAIRDTGGGIVTASGRKAQLPVGGGGVGRSGGVPLLRGLGRFAESLLVLAQVKLRLPNAQLPIQGGRVLAALVASFGATEAVKAVAPKSALVQEAGGALAAFLPAVLAVRNSKIAGYHGAEHKVIGGLEAEQRAVRRRALDAGPAVETATGGGTGATVGAPVGTNADAGAGARVGEGSIAGRGALATAPSDHAARAATKEHDRCGSNLIGPYMLATVATNLLARGKGGKKSPAASALAGAASLGIALEALRWATTHGDSVLARLLLLPGRAVQKNLTTSEPTAAQLEVGQRALKELLRLEAAGV